MKNYIKNCISLFGNTCEIACSINVIFLVLLSIWLVSPSESKTEESVREGLELELALSKSEYVYGEPIIMYLVARNTTKTKIITLVGEDTFGSSGYEIDGTDNQNQPLKRMYPYNTADGPIYPLSKFQCKPGQEIQDQVILQRFREFPGPGTYSVSCLYRTILGLDITSERSCMNPPDIPIYSKTGKVDYQTNKWATISKRFNIVVKPFDEQKVMAVATQLFARLSGPDIKTPRDPTIGSAYYYVGGENYTNGLDGLMPVSDIKTRLDALKALAYFSGSDTVYSNVIARLLLVMQDNNKAMQHEALKSLGIIWENPSALTLPVTLPLAQKQKILEAMHKLIFDCNTPAVIVMAMSKFGDKTSIPYITKMMNSNQFDYRTRGHIPYALEQIGLRGDKEKALAALQSLLKDPNAKFRQKVEQTIQRLESSQ